MNGRKLPGSLEYLNPLDCSWRTWSVEYRTEMERASKNLQTIVAFSQNRKKYMIQE